MRRRRLGAELRSLRESAGLTGDQVIERVGWASASKLSRLENGRSRPDLRDVLDLLELYQASDKQREELSAITREAGDMRTWLRSYAAMTPRQRHYAELEASCSDIHEYSPVIIPGLLQTEAYARIRIMSSRLLAAEPGGTESPEHEVAARIARQALLTQGNEPTRYTAVIEETALSGRAGPPHVIRGQIAQLRKVTVLPNVTLQILPTEATISSWYLPHTAFSIYRFTDPADPETLAIEGLSTNLMLTDREEINRYKVVFEWLQKAALTAEDTLNWLAEAAARGSGPVRTMATRGPATPPAQRSRRIERLREP